jgi:pilus assembly protein FimV
LPWYRNTKVLIGGSAGLIVLGALLALMGRRKAKPVEEEAPRSSVADQFAGGVFGARAAAGDDGEENALLERLAADPTDLDSHLDLLRLYHHSADVEKFESAANAMYAQVGDTSHPAWQQAMALGAEMLPDNPMFQAQDFGAGDSAFDLDSPPPASSPVAAAVKAGDSGMFDFDIDRKPASPAPPAAPAKSAASDFDFSLDVPEVKKPSAADVAPTAKITKPDPQAFKTQEFKAPDFDLDLGKPEPAKMTAKPAAAPAAPAAPDNFFEGEDAVGTKLDLARAYLDMGDPEGARSMLQEVLGEGTDSQKTEARKLLSEIG